MLIRYKEYIGALIYANQIKGSEFEFKIQDIDDVMINFKANMNEIKIVDCVGNTDILSDIKRKV